MHKGMTNLNNIHIITKFTRNHVAIKLAMRRSITLSNVPSII